MKGLKNSLIYWGWMLEKAMLTLVLGVMCYLVIMSLFGGTISTEEILENFPQCLCMLLCIGAFMNALSGVNTYFPMAISLGSTRKANYIAMQIVQHLVMLEFLVIGAAFYYFAQPEKISILTDYISTIIGAVLVLQALANLAGMVSVRFGKTAGVITYICIFLAFLASIIIGVISGISKDFVFIDALGAFAREPYLLIIGILCDSVVICGYYAAIKKNDLQF